MRARPIEELLSAESPELRERIRRRGQELIKAETLRQLRQLAGKTQGEVAGMRQDGVSRLEAREDLLLSSLQTYVRGLGGQLRIIAELPQIGEIDVQLRPATPTQKRSKTAGPSGARAASRRVHKAAG